MKKFFNTILTLAIVFTFTLNFNYYSTVGRVVGYDTLSDTLFIKSDGHIWEYAEIQDWDINDMCSMVFCDNGTEEIEDDEVVYMRYIGYLDIE